MRKNGEAALFFAGFNGVVCRASAHKSPSKRQIKRADREFQHHPPAVSGNSPVLSAFCAKPATSWGNAHVQGRIVSATGHKVVMPHGTAMCAQNRDRARRTAGNDGPENYRNIGKLSELNAGGAARLPHMFLKHDQKMWDIKCN